MHRILSVLIIQFLCNNVLVIGGDLLPPHRVLARTTSRATPSSTPIPPKIPPFVNCTQYSKTNELWTSFTGSKLCYWYSNDLGQNIGLTTSWHSAYDICRSKGADLVSIHDYDTNYIVSHPNGMNVGNYWVGLSSLNGTRGIFKWTDATPHQWDNFSNTTSYGDPLDKDVFNQGRCVCMLVLGTGINALYPNVGKWFKDDCFTNRRLICQRPNDPNATPAPPPVPTSGGCPLQDWYKYGDEKCVKYIDTELAFEQARMACNQSKAEVLAIHSQHEQDFVTTITAGLRAPYIGLHQDVLIGWKWDDQSSMTYTNFGVQDGSGDCGVVSTTDQPGKWIAVDCKQKHPIMCQTPQDPKKSAGRTLRGDKCKIPGYDNFMQFRNSCYNLIDDPNTHSNFLAAEKNCQDMKGAHLVSIVDSVEQSFLRYYLSQKGNSSKYWIGLHAELDKNDNSLVFEWMDGWPVYYTNWAKSEPKIPSTPHIQCVSYDKESGVWSTSECDQSMAYICKVTSDSIPQTPNVTNGYCPKLTGINDTSLAWINLHKGTPYCYWFSTERKLSNGLQSWYDASYHCHRRNGTLVAIHSEHELMILSARLKLQITMFISWIGLYKNPSGKFVWEDGSPLDFLNGLTVPVEDASNGTNLNDDSGILCGELRWDLTWNWVPCASNERNYFVCQISKIYPENEPIESTTNSNIEKKEESQMPSTGLSGGANAGIAFGVIAGVLIVLVVGFFALRRYRPNSTVVRSFENVLYSKN